MIFSEQECPNCQRDPAEDEGGHPYAAPKPGKGFSLRYVCLRPTRRVA